MPNNIHIQAAAIMMTLVPRSAAAHQVTGKQGCPGNVVVNYFTAEAISPVSLAADLSSVCVHSVQYDPDTEARVLRLKPQF